MTSRYRYVHDPDDAYDQEQDNSLPWSKQYGSAVVEPVRAPSRPQPRLSDPTIRTRRTPPGDTARWVGGMLYRFLDATIGASVLLFVMFGLVLIAGLYAEGYWQ